MRGHYFFKWLFLTILSVSALHLREARIACYQTEQVSHRKSIGGEQSLLAIGNYKRSTDQPPVFSNFKNTQHILLGLLSISLSGVANWRPDSSSNQECGRIHIRNQHFRSRALLSDDHSISLS